MSATLDTRLDWSALLDLISDYVWVNVTPTEEPGSGGVAFCAMLLRVVTIERHGAEWGVALIFYGSGRIAIPFDGFRGSLVSESGEVVIVTDHDTITLRPAA